VLWTLATLVLVPALQVSPAIAAEDISLGQGALGSSYGWSVLANRGDGSNGATHPCVSANFDRVPEGGFTSRLRLCGSIEGTQVVVSNSTGSGSAERTVIGMVFGQRVRYVRLWLRGRSSRKITLDRLSPAEAAAAHVVRFRYAALGMMGNFCLRRFASYDAQGDVIFLGREMGCGR